MDEVKIRKEELEYGFLRGGEDGRGGVIEARSEPEAV